MTTLKQKTTYVCYHQNHLSRSTVAGTKMLGVLPIAIFWLVYLYVGDAGGGQRPRSVICDDEDVVVTVRRVRVRNAQVEK